MPFPLEVVDSDALVVDMPSIRHVGEEDIIVVVQLDPVFRLIRLLLSGVAEDDIPVGVRETHVVPPFELRERVCSPVGDDGFSNRGVGRRSVSGPVVNVPRWAPMPTLPGDPNNYKLRYHNTLGLDWDPTRPPGGNKVENMYV